MAARGSSCRVVGENCLHPCVDMQRLFGAGSPWAVPWLGVSCRRSRSLCGAHTRRTVFTRFIPADQRRGPAQRVHGYYQRWADVTLENIGVDAVRLVPTLERWCPSSGGRQARLLALGEGNLDGLLAGSRVDTVVVSGGETDVCVLGTVLGAVDRGLRVILATRRPCSSSDNTHRRPHAGLQPDALASQIEAAETEEILIEWR